MLNVSRLIHSRVQVSHSAEPAGSDPVFAISDRDQRGRDPVIGAIGGYKRLMRP